MKAKQLVVTYLFSLYSLSLFSQTQSYIATDSTSVNGIRIIAGTDQENTYSIKVMVNSKQIKEYLPNQLNEYGLADGRVYVSRKINFKGYERSFFLQRLVRDSLTLYRYDGKDKKTFYLERDSGMLVEIDKKNPDFRKVLTENMRDCEAVHDAIQTVSYRKVPLTELVTRYNSCQSTTPFPYTK